MQTLTRWIGTFLVTVATISVGFAEPKTRPAGAQATAEKPQAESTKRMAKLLRLLAEEFEVSQANVAVNDRRAEMLRRDLAKTTDPKAQLNLEYLLAGELLAAGKSVESLAQLDRVERLAAERQVAWTRMESQVLKMARVQANMRLGEEQKCCAEHNPDSCLVPLRGAAIYKHQEGPREAIRLLNGILADAPDDLTARWLLN